MKRGRPKPSDTWFVGVVAVALSASQLGIPQADGSPASAMRCAIVDMALSGGPKWSEATEQHTVTVVLRNRLGISCAMDGYPTVSLVDKSGHLIRFTYSHHGDQMVTALRPHRVVLKPGARAYFVLNKTGCDAPASASATRVRVSLARFARSRTLRIPHYFPQLDYCGPGLFARITVSPIVASLGDASRVR